MLNDDIVTNTDYPAQSEEGNSIHDPINGDLRDGPILFEKLMESMEIIIVYDSHHKDIHTANFDRQANTLSVYAHTHATLGTIDKEFIRLCLRSYRFDWTCSLFELFPNAISPDTAKEPACKYFTGNKASFKDAEINEHEVALNFKFDKLKEYHSTCSSEDVILRYNDKAPECLYRQDQAACPFYVPDPTREHAHAALGDDEFVTLESYRLANNLTIYRIVYAKDENKTLVFNSYLEAYNKFVETTSDVEVTYNKNDTKNFFDNIKV